MSDTSAPWDGNPWAEVDWYRHMVTTMPSGVLGSPAASATDGSLAWSASGLSITPAAGRANVGGSGYVRSAPLSSVTVTANTHASYNRIDRLVLRRDLSSHQTTLTVIAGTPASAPAVPAITQNDETFDLPLFRFTVPSTSGTTLTGVVDERAWVAVYGRPMFVQSAAPAYAPDGALWFEVS